MKLLSSFFLNQTHESHNRQSLDTLLWKMPRDLAIDGATYKIITCSYRALQRTFPADLTAKPPNRRVSYLELKCSLQLATDRLAIVTAWASRIMPREMTATGKNAHWGGLNVSRTSLN